MAAQAFAGIVTVSVGHCHPAVVEAVQRQSALLQHTTTIYLNHQIAEYAKELTDRLPGNLKVQAPLQCALASGGLPQQAYPCPQVARAGQYVLSKAMSGGGDGGTS